ncbi:hypothetical protein HUW62_12665 [Myxococcus sp. AM011]|uniref:hypothetical protein n=1 Tax=Myxococcus sp. AM011 TaxID=2745200 RepID=UPI0015963239|nr:hypothetical protein [Myxococcus sp. AM011]NVJ22071.1 hypothetical protein [Myxococcus sp. AM011]
MSSQSNLESTQVGPAKPSPAPELIPTTETLIYGETLYLQVGGTKLLWLTGGRSEGNTQVNTLDGEGGAMEPSYRWTLMKARDSVGSGPVRYGDKVYLKVGGEKLRWLKGGFGEGQQGVSSLDGEGGKYEENYQWTVMESRSTVGSGEVKRGRALYLKVGGAKDRWLTGGRSDGNKQVRTLDGEGGKNEASYQWTSSPVSYSRVFAVFAEDSPETKKLKKGMNTRVFTRVEACSPERSIRLDLGTGVITVPPGTYDISGFSSTVYLTGQEEEGMVTNKSPTANGGYCRLRHAGGDSETIKNDDPRVLVVGSISTSNALPSVFQTWLTTPVEARLILEHQSGDPKEETIVLRHKTTPPLGESSTWHLFARLAITRT